MLEDIDMSNSLSPPRRRPKPQAENWDDDFEFSLPSAPSSKKSSTSNGASRSSNNASSSAPAKGKGKEKDENVPVIVRSNSPTEDWDEDWDESPPRNKTRSTSTTSAVKTSGLPSPSAKHERKKSSIPPPLTIPPPYSNTQQPRLSPSHTASLPALSPLPLPTSSSSSQLYQPLLPSRSNSSLGLAAQQADPLIQSHTQPRSRSGSTTTGTVTRNKLIKRHPSASFIPIPSRSASSSFNLPSNTFFPNESDASLSSTSFINHSSPNLPQAPPLPPLPRSTSGEQMPPPPLPSGRLSGEVILGVGRSRSRSKSRSGTHNRQEQEVRVSGIPFSPSRDDMKEQVPKKPGFWKRLSGAPSAPSGDRGELCMTFLRAF
ncbi:hypothetical protein IAU59_004523 [Kwoniella sp. CBS 9459]